MATLLLMKGVILPRGMGMVYLIMIAITGALGQIFLTYAYRLGPASEIAIYDQFSVVFAIVLGFLFLNQIPTPCTLFGGVLIVGASIAAYFYNMKNQVEWKDEIDNI
ncbi:EamA family transporter [Anaerotignum sp.]